MANDATRGDPRFVRAFGRFDPDGVHMTLDFMEAAGGPGEHGLVLLEGGPAHHPFGGGHCCAFAGKAGPPLVGSDVDVRGVAFRLMDHVVLAEPRTWVRKEGAEAGRILEWEAVEALASTAGDPDEPASTSDLPAGGDYRTFAQMREARAAQ